MVLGQWTTIIQNYFYQTFLGGLPIYDVRNLMDFNEIFLQLVCAARFRTKQAFKKAQLFDYQRIFAEHLLAPRTLCRKKTCYVTYVFVSRR